MKAICMKTITKWPCFRSRISKRRWIARWRNGQVIPFIALMEYPDLEKRLKPSRYLPHGDAIQRAA
jgi:hypothetical protein